MRRADARRHFLAGLHVHAVDQAGAGSLATAGNAIGDFHFAFRAGVAFRVGLVLAHLGDRDRSAVWAFVRDLGARLERAKLEEICKSVSSSDSFVQIANLLCPGNIAISGHTAAVAAAEAASITAGAMKAVRLQVAGAFHTAIMQPAVARLQAALADVQFMPMRVPVYSNVDGLPHSDSQEIRDLLCRQLVAPVQWESTLRNFIAAGVDQFVEIGAGRVLAGTLKRVDRKANCENVSD